MATEKQRWNMSPEKKEKLLLYENILDLIKEMYSIFCTVWKMLKSGFHNKMNYYIAITLIYSNNNYYYHLNNVVIPQNILEN